MLLKKYTRRAKFGQVGRTAALNLVTALTGAVTGVLIARGLGPADRGHYAAITSYFWILIIVAEMGLGAALVYHASREPERASALIATVSRLFVPLGGLAIAVTTAIGLVAFDSSNPQRDPFLLITVAIAATFLGAAPVAVLQTLSIDAWNIVRLIQPVAMFLVLLVVTVLDDFDLRDVVVALGATLLLQAVAAWLLVWRVNGRPSGYLSSRVPRLVKYGIANVASTAANSVNGRFDQLVLAFLVTASALGEYAVAVSLALLASPLAFAFGNVALPRIALGHDPVQASTSAIRGSLVVATGSIAAITAVSPWLVPAIYGSDYTRVPALLALLAPGAVAFILNQVVGDVLRGLGRPGLVARCEWIGVVGTGAGLLVLVPLLGPYGAAITSSLVYVVVHSLLRRTLRQELVRHAARPTVAHP